MHCKEQRNRPQRLLDQVVYAIVDLCNVISMILLSFAFIAAAVFSHHETSSFWIGSIISLEAHTSAHLSSSKHDPRYYNPLNSCLQWFGGFVRHGKLFAAYDVWNDRHHRIFANFLCAFVLEYSWTWKFHPMQLDEWSILSYFLEHSSVCSVFYSPNRTEKYHFP